MSHLFDAVPHDQPALVSTQRVYVGSPDRLGGGGFVITAQGPPISLLLTENTLQTLDDVGPNCSEALTLKWIALEIEEQRSAVAQNDQLVRAIEDQTPVVESTMYVGTVDGDLTLQ